MKKQKVTVTIIGRTLQIGRPKKGGRLLSSINIFFATTNQEEKCPNQKNLTFCQLSSAKVYVKGS